MGVRLDPVRPEQWSPRSLYGPARVDLDHTVDHPAPFVDRGIERARAGVGGVGMPQTSTNRTKTRRRLLPGLRLRPARLARALSGMRSGRPRPRGNREDRVISW